MAKLNEIIKKIMPYKVIAENHLLRINDELEIEMRGFTRRFAKQAKLEKYLKRKIHNETFSWNYTVDKNTYYVYPGKFSIAKAAAGI